MTSSDRYIGCVKWFNNKTGFGFITIVSDMNKGKDVFVHHSVIKSSEELYRYLVQGEYVEFSLIETESDKYDYQADNVCGFNGGKLMCETRHFNRIARNQYKDTKQQFNEAETTTTEQTTTEQTTTEPTTTSSVTKKYTKSNSKTKSKSKSKDTTNAKPDEDWTYVKKTRTGLPSTNPDQTMTTSTSVSSKRESNVSSSGRGGRGSKSDGSSSGRGGSGRGRSSRT